MFGGGRQRRQTGGRLYLLDRRSRRSSRTGVRVIGLDAPINRVGDGPMKAGRAVGMVVLLLAVHVIQGIRSLQGRRLLLLLKGYRHRRGRRGRFRVGRRPVHGPTGTFVGVVGGGGRARGGGG